MASLSSVPDPLDPDPGAPKPENAGQAPPANKSKLGKLFSKAGAAAEPGKKFSSPFQPYIATPAPKSLGRPEPAIDVDEHQSRSTMYDNADAVDAAAIALRCLNAWIRTRKTLFEGDPEAKEPERRVPLLVRERFGIQKLAQLSEPAARARAAVEQLPAGEPADRRAARERRDAVERANRLTHRTMEIEHRLNAITTEIDTAAQRVYDDIAGIIGHGWLAYEQRAAENPDLIGIWRTREAARAHAEIKFEEEFRMLPIPSIEEIDETIKAHRARLARTPAPQDQEPTE
jgi:hypothetical protein